MTSTYKIGMTSSVQTVIHFLSLQLFALRNISILYRTDSIKCYRKVILLSQIEYISFVWYKNIVDTIIMFLMIFNEIVNWCFAILYVKIIFCWFQLSLKTYTACIIFGMCVFERVFNRWLKLFPRSIPIFHFWVKLQIFVLSIVL